MKLKITTIAEKHIKEAHQIYNYYIKNSYSNFEEKIISYKNFHDFYKKIYLNKLPYLVALDKNKVVGIAYLNKFREKSGYRFTFEHSIYVKPSCLNNGYGTKILKELIKYSKKNKKIKNLIAVIGGSNNISSIKIRH